jgi:hypothetical protein
MNPAKNIPDQSTHKTPSLAKQVNPYNPSSNSQAEDMNVLTIGKDRFPEKYFSDNLSVFTIEVKYDDGIVIEGSLPDFAKDEVGHLAKQLNIEQRIKYLRTLRMVTK